MSEWNFGEVILQALNNQKNREAQAAAQATQIGAEKALQSQRLNQDQAQFTARQQQAHDEFLMQNAIAAGHLGVAQGGLKLSEDAQKFTQNEVFPWQKFTDRQHINQGWAANAVAQRHAGVAERTIGLDETKYNDYIGGQKLVGKAYGQLLDQNNPHRAEDAWKTITSDPMHTMYAVDHMGQPIQSALNREYLATSRRGEIRQVGDFTGAFNYADKSAWGRTGWIAGKALGWTGLGWTKSIPVETNPEAQKKLGLLGMIHMANQVTGSVDEEMAAIGHTPLSGEATDAASLYRNSMEYQNQINQGQK